MVRVMAVAPPALRWHEEVDIGIAGAGGCGLAAAHAAADGKLRIVVWEKSDAAGGNTALSCGMIAAAGTAQQRAAGVFDVGEDFARDILTRNSGHSDAVLTRRLCEGSGSLVEWLGDRCGIALELVPTVYDAGHTRLRLHAPAARSGRPLVQALLRSLDRHGISLHPATPVLQLWTDAAGAVLGVQVKRARKAPSNVRCHKLILATGGFGANPAVLAQHCRAAEGLRYAGHPGSSGEALVWGADVGTATRDLDAYDAHASVAVGSNLLIPWIVITAGALLVNQRGERFADETCGPATMVPHVLAQPGRVAYEIFDGRISKAVAVADARFANEIVPRVVRRADDIEGLARQFQIDPPVLAQTVAAYNAAAGGNDPFGRTAFGGPLSAPFYGIRIAPALLQTQGGLVIDPSARVLRADGAIVPNLYAGGGAAVGLSAPGGDGCLLGNGLLCALGWGKIAGEQAAHEILTVRAGSEGLPPTPSIEGEGGPGTLT
jgi:fumarate reductase flavoprotein subunit